MVWDYETNLSTVGKQKQEPTSWFYEIFDEMGLAISSSLDNSNAGEIMVNIAI